MGLFDFFKKKQVDETQYQQVQGLSWYPPVYSQFGSDIYASDVVQQVVSCIALEMKKLKPVHVLVKDNNSVVTVRDDIQRVLDNPNPLMTTCDFIEKIVRILFADCNVFIFPTWDGKRMTGLYPLQPQNVDFVEDAGGAIFVKLTFANGVKSVVPYAELIHVRHNFSVSEFMGGNIDGQPDNKALLKTLKLNDVLLDGVGKALQSSFLLNGIIKYNTLIDQQKTEEEIKRLTEQVKNDEHGFMKMDLKGEFIPLKRDIKLVEEPTLKFIDEKILRHYGVPLPILTGDYTKEQYEAFFQKTIEPLVISLNQAFTKGIFSPKRSFGYGNEIRFTHDLLSFMTMQEKIEWLNLASTTGAVMTNEIRTMIGFPPYEDEELGNTPVMSKNFGDAGSVKNQVDKESGNVHNDSEVQNEEKPADN